jgi:hypothetical protein
MDISNRWETSLSDLLDIFRQSLSALAPILEKAKISWQEAEAYDDWDSIAANLFENIVVNSLRFSQEITSDLRLPEYDIIYPSYKDFDIIFVEGSDIPMGTLAVFIGLAGTSQDFSTVKWLEVDSNGSVIAEEVRHAAFGQSKFFLLHAGNIRVDSLTVEL